MGAGGVKGILLNVKVTAKGLCFQFLSLFVSLANLEKTKQNTGVNTQWNTTQPQIVRSSCPVTAWMSPEDVMLSEISRPRRTGAASSHLK